MCDFYISPTDWEFYVRKFTAGDGGRGWEGGGNIFLKIYSERRDKVIHVYKEIVL